MTLYYPCLHVYVAPWLRCQSSQLHYPLGIVNLLMFKIEYIHDLTYTHTQGRFIDHTIHSLYRILYMATSVMKMESIVPRAGMESSFLAFWASVLTFTTPRPPDVTMLPTPVCLCWSLPHRPVQTTIMAYVNGHNCTLEYINYLRIFSFGNYLVN